MMIVVVLSKTHTSVTTLHVIGTMCNSVVILYSCDNHYIASYVARILDDHGNDDGIIYLDFHKAFDHVPHQHVAIIYNNKVKAYGTAINRHFW